MGSNLTQERKEAHAYLDRLPGKQLSAVRDLLESMLSPLELKLATAPLDDEPFTEEDRQAVAEADGWLKHNEPIPLESVLEEFGLTMTDWETMAAAPLPEETGGRNA